jgi:hypothetical protein
MSLPLKPGAELSSQPHGLCFAVQNPAARHVQPMGHGPQAAKGGWDTARHTIRNPLTLLSGEGAVTGQHAHRAWTLKRAVALQQGLDRWVQSCGVFGSVSLTTHWHGGLGRVANGMCAVGDLCLELPRAGIVLPRSTEGPSLGLVTL